MAGSAVPGSPERTDSRSLPTGYSQAAQQGSGSRLRGAVSQAGSFFWTVVTFPGGCWLFRARLSPFPTAAPSRPSLLGVQPTQRGCGTTREAHSRIITGAKSHGDIRAVGRAGALWRRALVECVCVGGGGVRGTGGQRPGQRCLAGVWRGRDRRGRERGALQPRLQALPLGVALRPDGPSSRPALRTPLLVGRHHLVPPDDGCLPPRRLRSNQVSRLLLDRVRKSQAESQASPAPSCWWGLGSSPGPVLTWTPGSASTSGAA